MTTEGQRVKEIRKKLGFTQKEFAEILGFQESFMSSVENNRNLLSHDKQLLLLQKYNVNINYLLAGIPPMFITDKPEPPVLDEEALEILGKMKQVFGKSS